MVFAQQSCTMTFSTFINKGLTMKKFALLFALFAGIGLAQADVGVFGTMDAGYNSTRAPGAATATTSYQSGGMTTSFFGAKGSEDLGNGSKAIFVIPPFISTEDTLAAAPTPYVNLGFEPKTISSPT